MWTIYFFILLHFHSSNAFSPVTFISSRNAITESVEWSSFSSSSCGFSLWELSNSNSDNNEDDDDGDVDGTISIIKSPSGKQITLIGTAHLSKRSNTQVKRVIETINPNVVMVELDRTRLSRIGIDKIEDIQLNKVTTSQDIELPSVYNDNRDDTWNPLQIVQNVLVEGFTRVSRTLLTGMYNDMSKKMNNSEGGGGEFLVAIRAAEACSQCHTLILGDRDSLTTIRRAAILALESGDPFSVLQRLQQANSQEMNEMQSRVRLALQEEQRQNQEKQQNVAITPIDESLVQIGMMEALKEDAGFRDRLFEKLEQEVPEFTQAFLKERDYIMSESIRRELEFPGVQNVVGVVGLAHLPGMKANFQAIFADQPVPLQIKSTPTDELNTPTGTNVYFVFVVQ